MRIAVTGGAGFIGSHAARRLAGLGADVVVLDTLETGRREALEGVPHRFILGSILDDGALKEALEGCGALVHLAALVSVPASLKEPEKAREVNDEGSRRTLQAAMELGVKRVVQASTSAVYGPRPQLPSREDSPVEPASPYASSKLAAEGHALRLREKGLEAASIRFFNVYGPGQDPSSSYSGVVSIFLEKAMSGRPAKIFGDGLQTRDFIHVSEAVQAIEKAIFLPEAPPPVVNIGTGRSITLLELLDAVEAAAGASVTRIFAPERPGDVRHSSADISLAQRALGFASGIGVREGLAWMLREEGSRLRE